MNDCILQGYGPDQAVNLLRLNLIVVRCFYLTAIKKLIIFRLFTNQISEYPCCKKH